MVRSSFSFSSSSSKFLEKPRTRRRTRTRASRAIVWRRDAADTRRRGRPALQLTRAALDVIPRIHQSPFMYRMIGADGREYGPISAEQLRQWIGQGRANAATSVLPEGASEWKPLGSLPEFSMLFAAPASTPAPGPMPGAAPAAPAVFPTSTVQPLRTNGFATAGLVLGIVSITLGLCCCYGIPFNIAGLIFSIIAISQINSH